MTIKEETISFCNEELYPLNSIDLKQFKQYLKEDLEYLALPKDILKSFKSINYVLENAIYPLCVLKYNSSYQNQLGMNGYGQLVHDIKTITNYILRDFQAINFKNTSEQEVEAWYRFDNKLSLTEVFSDEIEQQDKGVLSDRSTVFPSSVEDCKIVGNDVYVHYDLIMDMSRPRNSQYRASKEFFIKDGMLKYNKMQKEKQEKNQKSYTELVEKEKQKRRNIINRFQNRYFSVNRISNLLLIVTGHYESYILKDRSNWASYSMYNQTYKNNRDFWNAVPDTLNDVGKLFDYVVSFSYKIYDLKVA